MEGLRRLAYTIHEEDRAVKIEIPTVCEFYVDSELPYLLLDTIDTHSRPRLLQIWIPST